MELLNELVAFQVLGTEPPLYILLQLTYGNKIPPISSPLGWFFIPIFLSYTGVRGN
jgi:hypothetical protein